MSPFSPSEWQEANDEARSREQRQRHVQYLLTMAAMRHRSADIQVQNMDLIGGVPVGRLRFSVDVDSIAFWNTLHELKQRKGWW